MEYGQVSNTYREGFLAFLIATCLFIGLHQLHNVTYFPWDAKGYWELSDPATFLNFPKEIRGYFYPLLLLPAHFISNTLIGYEIYPYRIYSSLVYGLLLTNVLPAFYLRIFGGKLTLTRRLLVPALIAVLFPGLVIYPLSDLPAFLLLVGSIFIVMKAKTTRSLTTAGTLTLLGGIFAAGAYNTRTIYLFPLICVFCAIPFYFFSAKPAKHRLLALAAFSLGGILVCAPQSLINHSTHGTWSPAVVSQKTEKSLFALQLMWGITIQRYETTIDPTSASASRYFMDRAGEQLFTSESLEKSDVTIRNYISLVARHPMDFLGIYARHLVNGLDLRDGEVYVKHAKWVNNKKAVVNFIAIALGLLIVLIRYIDCHPPLCAPSKISLGDHAPADSAWPLWLFILLLPVCAILPGAIETRFFLPLHILLYCTIAFNTSATELTDFLKRHWLPMLCGVGLLCVLFFAISTNTMSSMQPFIHPPYRFGQ